MKKRAEELIADKKADSLHSLTETSVPGTAWEHARELLAVEEFGRISVKEGLERLIEMKRKIAADTESSKARDDERGNRIIDDYKFTHESASEDSFIKDIRKQTEELKAEIEIIREFL